MLSSTFFQSAVRLHIAYGLCSSFQTFPQRFELMTQWWQSGMSGAVFVDVLPEGLDRRALPKGLDVLVSSRPWTFVSEAERCAWSQIADLHNNFPEADWFVIGDDDTFFVPSAIDLYLQQLSAKEKWYIGSPSESASQRALYGNLKLVNGDVMKDFAFGGGGVIISGALMREMAPHMQQCLLDYTSLFGSDQRIAVCAQQAGANLTDNRGMHQCDLGTTNIMSLLEAHPLTPLLSLHHMNSVQLAEGKTLLDVRGSRLRNPFGALQQSVCIANAGTFSIASGLSVRWWSSQTFVNVFDLTDTAQQASLPSDTLRRFDISADIRLATTGTTDRIQTVYTSRQTPDIGRHQVDTVIVDEPASASRWSVRHRLNCQGVEEMLPNRSIHIHLSED